MAHGWWTARGQADARFPSGYGLPVPRVPVAGGQTPEQWSITQLIPANSTVPLLQLNMPADQDHVMVWSENVGPGGFRLQVIERVPRGEKIVEFDCGPGGGNQAIVRGAVPIQATTAANAATVALWVYPGDILDRAPIGPGGDTSPAGTGWPPKDRNNLTITAGANFDWRLLDEGGAIVGTRLNQDLENFYHPPRARLQTRNRGSTAGSPVSINICAVWRRTA